MTNVFPKWEAILRVLQTDGVCNTLCSTCVCKLGNDLSGDYCAFGCNSEERTTWARYLISKSNNDIIPEHIYIELLEYLI